MTDLRKAAEMALEALDGIHVGNMTPMAEENWNKALTALRQALAQPEQSKYSDIVSDGGLDPRNKFDTQPEQEPVAWMTNSEQDTTAEYMFCHVQTPMHDIPLYEAPPSKPKKEKESTPSNVDPRLLLGRSNNFTKETENRLCDIERRLAVIETQQAPPSKPWVSLTDNEIINTANEAPFEQMVKADDYIYIIARAIEAALRSKNT